MSEDSALRSRSSKKGDINQNGHLQNRNEKKKWVDMSFLPRESPLTVLLSTSLHIRAIYHIFIAILIILMMDTFMYDFVEFGKIKLGVYPVIYGFGDIGRCGRLWLFELALALAFYPGLRVYGLGARVLRKHTVLSAAWSTLGAAGLAALLGALLGVPSWDLGRRHLALASGCIVTLEMIRFAMKIYAVTVACVPRCHAAGGTPLPSFRHYLYFLFAPTLLYRDKYPRTEKTRWGVVALHLLEVVAIIFYNSFLWERFILPYWSDYGKEPQVQLGRVVQAMFACVLPSIISFLCGFYCVLHAWLNAFAEMLTFADRLFYEEWWTMSEYSKYYRAWNRVVYAWLRDHIYIPLVPRAGRSLATLSVFLISAVFHELVLALSFGFFYPVLLVMFGVFGLLCVPLTATCGRLFPGVFNLVMWLTLMVGNGLLWSLYPMEYFARKNCPASPGDSFFVPKSWSCPEIVMKSNWTFNNPFTF
ncbi:hypothetical protein JYU34_007425 [Plutella xylostella]|uniref:O-acyltransferase n=1 Tax=Plutella xylostella TaxID=51655 RepID=A0ABQ7QQD9_PLUXY|nr:hypothetical protein JYU34_007425 [Plutella xylostella]